MAGARPSSALEVTSSHRTYHSPRSNTERTTYQEPPVIVEVQMRVALPRLTTDNGTGVLLLLTAQCNQQ